MGARWKIWNHRLDRPRGASGQVEPRFDARVDGLDLLAVAYVVPEDTEVREYRTVRIQLGADGSVTVTSSITAMPEDDDGTATYPTHSVEHYLPGWGEFGDWGRAR